MVHYANVMLGTLCLELGRAHYVYDRDMREHYVYNIGVHYANNIRIYYIYHGGVHYVNCRMVHYV
jgi:hypothetical protein